MKDKYHAILALLLSLASLLLFLLPSGFERKDATFSTRAKGVVLEVDDSRIFRFGIVREGVQEVKLRILRGPYKGLEVEASNQLIGKMELDKLFAPGDKALVVLDLNGDRVVHANVVDHYRLDTELLLFGLFSVLLVAFAGWTGLSALLSFVFSALVIWKILLPGFLKGMDPLR